MSKLISKSKLIPLVKEAGFKLASVSYEAYGRKVCAFLGLVDKDQCGALMDFLELQNLKVDRGYSWPGCREVCVQVSYFKAWHWDE